MSRTSNQMPYLTVSILLLAILCTTAMGKTFYVDGDAIGLNNGSSWSDAYNYLQDALADANSADELVEIRIAQGVYKPDQGAGITPGDREATFQIINGVTLKGGYTGFGEQYPDDRDVELYETILSGDLDGDDADVPDAASLLGHITRVENSYHVLTAQDIEYDTTLDGFTIVGGNANGKEDKDIYGGGIYCNNSFLKIINCTFQGNTSSKYGGAIHNHCLGELIITHCKFIRNASMWGGAIDNGCSNPTLTDCIFRENYSLGTGGAVHNSRGAPLLINCKFEYNSSCRGGGMYNLCYGDPTLIDCAFIGNSAEHFGGGMYNKSSTNGQLFLGCTFKDNHASIYGGGLYNTYNSKPVIKNCLFVNNSSDNWGGAIHFRDSNGVVINCTIVNNSAVNGGAVGCGAWEEIKPSNVKLTNCILWGNGHEIYNDDDSLITVTFSCVKGLRAGRYGMPEGCINQDPCLVDPMNHDYHLKSQSGRYDPNTQIWIMDDVTSPCIDAGDPNSPIGYEPIPNGGIINMGAYGGTQQASMSLNNICDISVLDQASNPIPTDGAVSVALSTNLSWTAGLNAESHEVYFGTSNLPPFTHKQFETEFDPGPLLGDTTYYWRIDEIDDQGNRTTGNIWTFITVPPPAQAYYPIPADGSVGVPPQVTLSWAAGLNAVSHDVYFETTNPPPFIRNQTHTKFDITRLNYSTTYYWRIDEVDNNGQITTGEVWTFATTSPPTTR